MRLITFTVGADPTPKLGAIVGDSVVDLVPALVGRVDVPARMIDFITAGPALHASVRDALTSTDSWPAGTTHDLTAVTLQAPLRPGKVIGVGLNYVEHVEESSRSLDTAKELPDRPVLFSKPATAIVGPDQPIRHNAALTAQLDWECELAVVIGREAVGVPESTALDYVFGYSIINDISARDAQYAEMVGRLGPAKGKDFDTGNVLGPWLVTADEIPHPDRLTMIARINGEEWSRGISGDMQHSFEDILAHISSSETLHAGEFIGSGTVGGGCGIELGRRLSPGDVIELEVEGIGVLRNRIVRRDA